MSDTNKKLVEEFDDLSIKETLDWLNSLTEGQKKAFGDYLQSDVYKEHVRQRRIEEERAWCRSIETEADEVHVENKTIIITDPCYISDGDCEDWKNDYDPYIVKNTIYGDWSCRVYKGNKEDLERIINEWDTFYQDWWKRWNFENLTEQEKGKLKKEYEEKEAEYKKKYSYGSFCADAGMVAVYDSSKIPTEKLEWCKSHDWCACFIENYTGPIKFVVEEEVDEDGCKHKSAHIVGDGFYSSQSGF